jgi:hypothetical protein
MTSSTAFNRAFAMSLMMDLVSDDQHFYSDNVLALTTMPKHSKNVTQDVTTVYVAHKGAVSSGHWADFVLGA